MRRLAPMFVITSLVALASGSVLANDAANKAAMKTDATSLNQPPSSTPASTAAATGTTSTMSAPGPDQVAVNPTDSTEKDNKQPPMNTGKAHVKKAKKHSTIANNATNGSAGSSGSSAGPGSAGGPGGGASSSR